MDRIVICVAITGALIRFGNFINAEIIGTPTRSNYGVVFARDLVDRLENVNQIEEAKVLKDNSREIDELGYVPVEVEITFDKSVIDRSNVEQFVRTHVKTI